MLCLGYDKCVGIDGLLRLEGLRNHFEILTPVSTYVSLHFQSNISVAFRELRDDADFFDITLACEDKQVQAHKVILSACSPWFRGVLKKNPHQHPLLYLKGVRHSDLISVLNFMYHGEVNVSQDELNSFLAVAEELSVKGLTQNDNEKPKPTVKNEPSDLGKRPSSHSSSIPPVKKPRVSAPPSTSGDNSKQSFDEDDIQEIMPVKAEPAGAASMTVTPDVPAAAGQTFDPNQSGIDASFGDESYDYEQYDEGAADDYGEGGQYDPNAMAGTSGGADGNKGRKKSFCFAGGTLSLLWNDVDQHYSYCTDIL